jgi:hypothetical protein
MLQAKKGKLKKIPEPMEQGENITAACSPDGSNMWNAGATLQQRRGFDISKGEEEQFGKYQSYMQAFNMEVWLDALRDVTMETTLVPMGAAHAEALVKACEAAQEQGATQDFEKEVQLSDGVASVLSDLFSRRLQPAMNALTDSMSGGCFVKTSSRSAKDHADLDTLKDRLLSAMENQLGISVSSGQKPDENANMIAMSYASMEQLKMADAEHVMHIFTRSERIWHDMHLALNQYKRRNTWDESAQSLVVRRWIRFEPDMEFRCFICEGQVVAISQYRHLCYFPRLCANRSIILDTLTSFLNDLCLPVLKGVFPLDDYVLDVGIELSEAVSSESMTSTGILDDAPGSLADPTGATKVHKCWAIEANPYFETTDGCLFSWEKDRGTLLRACRPPFERVDIGKSDPNPEFRIVTQAKRGASSLVFGCWKKAMQDARFK